jgi:outer membrane protein
MRKYLLTISLCGASLAAQADAMLFGFAAAVSPPLYRDQPNRVIPFPYMEYRGERVFVSGPAVGYDVVKGERLSVAALLEVHFMRFDPAEADTGAMAALDERRFGTLAGAQVEYRFSRKDALTLKLVTDVAGRHDALLPSLSWQHGFSFSSERARYFAFAALGALPEEYTRYYFGVTPAETARGGPPSYTPGSALLADLGFGAARQLAGQWQLMALLGARHYDAEVADSPMVERATAPFGLVGVAYRF